MDVDPLIVSPVKEALQCGLCMKVFVSQFILKRHVKRYHSEVFLTCYYCGFRTKYKSNLIKHIKKHLEGKERSWRGSSTSVYTCTLCDVFQSGNRNEVVDHYVTAHEVSIEPVDFDFNDWGEFLAWKAHIETQDLIKFTKTRGSKKTAQAIMCQFYCFRNGFYRKQGTGRRRTKLLGSNRLNSVCPSLIKTVQNRSTGSVHVTYIASHVGHVAEPSRMSLNEREKEELASKIAMNVPFDKILDNIRDEAVACNQITRVHLTTRKDLWNIERSVRKRANKSTTTLLDLSHADGSEWVVQPGEVKQDEESGAGRTQSPGVDPLSDCVTETASADDCDDPVERDKRDLEAEFRQILDHVTSSSGARIVKDLLRPALQLLKREASIKPDCP